MPRPRSLLGLKFHHFESNPHFERLLAEKPLERVKRIDAQARESGLETLEPASDPLIPIGMEIDGQGRVTKNGYGVLHLPWLAARHPEWANQIETEVEQFRKDLRRVHKTSLKYLIWAGMGGSAEDKAFYLSAKLLHRRVRTYLLDSTDPAKLGSILDELARREKLSLEQALRKTMVVGMAMGMTSYEPVLNLEKLDELYRRLGVPHDRNFIYLTLPDSILDRFGRERGFRRVELQLDSGNSTAGRHSGPLTRGSLYPLALNGVDIAAWLEAAQLSEKEIRAAFELAGFIESNAREGRDKLTLHLPAEWAGGAVWTKQDFEESLGKSEEIGVKVVTNEKIKPVNYYPPKSSEQDRCFLFVQVDGKRNVDPAKIAALRRAGYPLAVLQLEGPCATPRYMQFIHYAVFGLGYLRRMNFVTQPNVELYKDYARSINEEAKRKGGIRKSGAWQKFERSSRRLKWMGGLSIDFSLLVETGFARPEHLQTENGNAPAVYAEVLQEARASGRSTYGELTFFGDTRYHPPGRRLLRTLDAAADAVFRSRLRMPCDVYEGPAMNHSYHETIIGYGRGFSTVLLTEEDYPLRRIDYSSDYHRAQWLATQRALADRGRAVAGMLIRDLSDSSAETVREFFREVSRRLRRRRG